MGKIWFCKVGEAAERDVPEGGDAPMRDAIVRAYKRTIGEEPAFVFSGWGGELTEGERAVVEDRLPDRSKVTREIPWDVTEEMIERGWLASTSETMTRAEVAAILRSAIEGSPVDV